MNTSMGLWHTLMCLFLSKGILTLYQEGFGLLKPQWSYQERKYNYHRAIGKALGFFFPKYMHL